VRDEDATAGLWEAADLQWWWRTPRRSDERDQTFWLDGSGPVGALLLTDWGERWTCDPITLPSRRAELLPAIWAQAVADMDALPATFVDLAVSDDDQQLRELATASGFAPADVRYAETWQRSQQHRVVPALPAGYELHDRSEPALGEHHFARRSGPEAGRRLLGTPLYRPDLDLFVTDDKGEVAAYTLLWFDPHTLVGLVEPMRTEDEHQGRGLARHLLAAGLKRLDRLGARRAKVSYDLANPAAERLYLGTGFVTESTSTVLRRQIERLTPSQ
jgi:GNAT superfamily N-acetyltransferase